MMEVEIGKCLSVLETIHVSSRAPFSTSTITCKTWLKGGVLLKSLKIGEMIKLDLRIYNINMIIIYMFF